MNYEGDQFERMREPGGRLMREIELLMTDSENKDIPEILDAVSSKIPRALDEALRTGALSDEQKAEALKDLTNIREDVDRQLEDSDNKNLIMKNFESLLNTLSNA